MKLEQLQIFHNLTEDEMQKSLVCSQAVVQKYQKNEYIFRQGDRPEKLYFLLNGDVEVGSKKTSAKLNCFSINRLIRAMQRLRML